MTRIRNNLKYDNIRMLESGYGISLRTLTLFAEKTYKNIGPMKAALKAISVILFKLEAKIKILNSTLPSHSGIYFYINGI